MTALQLRNHPDFDGIYAYYLIRGGRKTKKKFSINLSLSYSMLHGNYDKFDAYQLSHAWIRLCNIMTETEAWKMEACFNRSKSYKQMNAYVLFK